MPDPTVLLSRDKKEHWNGDCPKCGGDMAPPDMGQLHIDDGEFVAITQDCNECDFTVESFYDWDRTEEKSE